VSEEERKRLIQEKLKASDLANLVNTEGSPQNLALTWLTDLDPSYICPQNDRLLQRYSIAVFYYATEGNDWLKCSAPEDFEDQAAIEVAAQNCPGTPWLTAGSECDWAGLTCNDKNEIQRIDIGKY
jgi:hypothetical protein